MSEGIIVAIITGVAGIIAAWLQTRQSKRKEKKEPNKVADNRLQPSEIANGPRKSGSTTKQDVLKIGGAREGVSTLTHAEIVQTIESAPPFHQQDIHSKFVGMRVCWESKLYGVSRTKRFSSVHAEVPGGGGGSMHCYATEKECMKFVASPKGAAFRVTGVIEKVLRYDVSLTDCSFTLADEPSPTHS